MLLLDNSTRYSHKRFLNRHLKIEKPKVDFIIKTFFDKMDLRLFNFHVMKLQKCGPFSLPLLKDSKMLPRAQKDFAKETIKKTTFFFRHRRVTNFFGMLEPMNELNHLNELLNLFCADVSLYTFF